MSTTSWPAVLVWARSTIAAVRPDVKPERAFRHIDGFKSLVDEPKQTFDRGFVVEGGSARDGNWYGAPTSRDVPKELIVSIGYHANLDRKTLEERIGRDEEQITSALLLKTGSPPGVSLVTFTDSTIDRAPVPLDLDKHVLEIRFVVTYRTEF